MKKLVLVADPREPFRQRLSAVFAQNPTDVVVFEAATGEELQRQLQSHSFDLIVVTQSLVTDLTILQHNNFIILAAVPDIAMLFATRTHGGRAYFHESIPGAVLRQILEVPQGAFITDPIVSARLTEYFAHHLLLSISDEALSEREREIFRLLWDGWNKTDIASRFGISKHTVSTHIAHIYEKLSINRFQAKILSILHDPTIDEQ